MNDDPFMQLISEGVLGEFAAASRKHKVMISITITPFEEEAEDSA
jgi:hypothetical protein